MQGKSDFTSFVLNDMFPLTIYLKCCHALFPKGRVSDLLKSSVFAMYFLITYAGVASTHNKNGGYIESFTQYINFHLLPFWGQFCTFQWDECSQLVGDSDIAGF